MAKRTSTATVPTMGSFHAAAASRSRSDIAGLRAASKGGGPGSVLGLRLAVGMERLQEGDERGGLGGREVLSVGGHVAPALDHLADELIARQSDRDFVERRTALATAVAEGVAVAALLDLEDQRSLALQGRPVREELVRDRLAAPRLHREAPGRVQAQARERGPAYGDEHDRHHGEGPAPDALLSFAGDERERDQPDQDQRGPDQQHRRFV